MASHWLITGATGLLADYLAEACARTDRVTTTSRSGGDSRCDLSEQDAVHNLICEVAPDVVVHAAGLTDVERCESNPDEAFAANRDAAANLRVSLPDSTRLVVISTDQVYPDKHGPHGEDDAEPVNMYGRSKLEGEQAALKHAQALVLRTNFFGPSRKPARNSLSDFFIDKFSCGEDVKLFDDVLFSPLHMATLGALVVELVERDVTGVLNAGCRAGDSKAEFALAVARHKGLSTDKAEISASTTLPNRAPRPRDLRLDVSKIESVLGREMPSLEEEIEKL
jgi:dTDP-4-dehydrorhamnose reductase